MLVDTSAITLLSGVPAFQGTPFIGDDTNNADSDSKTTRFIQVAFVDFNQTFPTGPLELFDTTFTATAVGTANFNYSFVDPVGQTETKGATATIKEPEVVLPTVSVSVSPSSVLEDGAGNLTYTFTRTGGTAAPLTVQYLSVGTATAGVDFTGSVRVW